MWGYSTIQNRYPSFIFLGLADNYYISRGENNIPQLNYTTVLSHRNNKKVNVREKENLGGYYIKLNMVKVSENFLRSYLEGRLELKRYEFYRKKNMKIQKTGFS